MNWDLKLAISMYSLKRARETMSEAKILLENQLYNGAVSRCYYACYHAVSALLTIDDNLIKSHKGSKSLFNRDYVLKGLVHSEQGELFNALFDEHHEDDYGAFVPTDPEDAQFYLESATPFIELLESMVHQKSQVAQA